jgi:hypothetical protein
VTEYPASPGPAQTLTPETTPEAEPPKSAALGDVEDAVTDATVPDSAPSRGQTSGAEEARGERSGHGASLRASAPWVGFVTKKGHAAETRGPWPTSQDEMACEKSP